MSEPQNPSQPHNPAQPHSNPAQQPTGGYDPALLADIYGQDAVAQDPQQWSHYDSASYGSPQGYDPNQAGAQPGFGATSSPQAHETGGHNSYGDYYGSQYAYAGSQPDGSHGYYPLPHDPTGGLGYSDKSKLAAGLLQIFLGQFGIGRFYLGHYGIAVAQLLTCGGCGIWALIDGVLILTDQVKDVDGRPLRD